MDHLVIPKALKAAYGFRNQPLGWYSIIGRLCSDNAALDASIRLIMKGLDLFWRIWLIVRLPPKNKLTSSVSSLILIYFLAVSGSGDWSVKHTWAIWNKLIRKRYMVQCPQDNRRLWKWILLWEWSWQENYKCPNINGWPLIMYGCL